MISFQCEHCEKRLKAPPEKGGKRVKCPNCGKPTRIPPADVPAATANDAPASPPTAKEPVAGTVPQQNTEEPQPASADHSDEVEMTLVAPSPAGDVVPSFDAPVPDLAIPSVDESAPSRPIKRRRKRSMLPLVIWGVLLSALGGLAWFALNGEPPPPKLAAISSAKVLELKEFTFQLKTIDAEPWKDRITFGMKESLEGATIDPKTGRFKWTPTEDQGPSKFELTVAMIVDERPDLSQERTFQVEVKESNEPPTLYPIENATISAGDLFAFDVKADDFDLPKQALLYSFGEVSRNTSARLDPSTGKFYWQTDEADGGRSYKFEVVVKEASPGLSSRQFFWIEVREADGPLKLLLAKLNDADVNAQLGRKETFLPFLEESQLALIEKQPVRFFEYFSPDAASEAVSQIEENGSVIRGKEMSWKQPTTLFHKDRLIAVYEGTDRDTLAILSTHLGTPFANNGGKPMTVVAETKDESQVGEEEILGFHQRKRLFSKDAFETLRNVYSRRFEEKYADEIQAAYGNENREMTTWLEEHAEIKETFYTAIDQKHDNVAAALKIFLEMKEQFPKEMEKYAQLAIAVAVTWDNEEGVYDYTRHQRRTKSIMPSDHLDAIANFRYFLDTEKVMQGRAEFLPWEFLKHLVNHTTPMNERQWALQGYLSHRTMFGGCYHDVPYDDDMLASQSEVAQLNDKEYSLPNLKQFGGVCAMQADYASRVGKSMGVPAEYVRGQSRSGDWHAWVMWAELKQVTKKGIVFSLESYGRYRGDKYYVGQLVEPQTGEWITDRELELRLHTVGLNTDAKRHAELIMQAYPMIKEKAELSIGDQFILLNRVIELCPGLEQAWLELSKIAREEEVAKNHIRTMLKTLDNLFKTFANFPDFTWVVFDDLVAFQTDPRKRNEYYQRLVTLYEQAGRPDLACEARLKLTEYLLAENEQGAAIEGLAYTIKKFPDEGRYVPDLLDSLEAICKDVEGAQEQLILFYRDFLPLIPQMRGDTPSKYCMEMFQRGIVRFRDAGQEQLAQLFEAQLIKIRSGMGRKS